MTICRDHGYDHMCEPGIRCSWPRGSKTFTSYDRSPVTRGGSVVEYLLLPPLPPPGLRPTVSCQIYRPKEVMGAESRPIVHSTRTTAELG